MVAAEAAVRIVVLSCGKRSESHTLPYQLSHDVVDQSTWDGHADDLPELMTDALLEACWMAGCLQ